MAGSGSVKNVRRLINVNRTTLTTWVFEAPWHQKVKRLEWCDDPDRNTFELQEPFYEYARLPPDCGLDQGMYWIDEERVLKPVLLSNPKRFLRVHVDDYEVTRGLGGLYPVALTGKHWVDPCLPVAVRWLLGKGPSPLPTRVRLIPDGEYIVAKYGLWLEIAK